MIYTGAIVTADFALEIGLIDRITDGLASEEDGGVDLMSRRSFAGVLSERSARIEDFFATYQVDELLDPAFPMPPEPYLVRAVVQVRGKAPLALRLAERIIDRGMALPLDEGLKEEYSQLGAVFSTDDARTGLLSFGKVRPRFVGR
jgi:enoyl-CoA hydratase/carnithine racemase